MGLTRARVTVFAQILQSGSSLVVSILLMPILGTNGYGILVLGISLQLLVVGSLDSAILTPLSVRDSHENSSEGGEYYSKFIPLILVVVCCAVISGWLLMVFATPFLNINLENTITLTLAISAGAFSLCIRESVRQTLILKRQLTRIVSMEILVNALMVASTLFVFVLMTDGISAPSAFLIIAAVNLTYLMYFPSVWPRHSSRLSISFKNVKAIFSGGGYSFASAQITWAQSQTYIYFVSALLSAAVLGLVAAARLAFAPLQTIYSGLARGLLPDLSTEFANGRIRAFKRTIVRAFAGIFALSIGWTWAIIAVSPELARFPRFAEFVPEFSLLIAWGAVFTISGARTVVSLGIKACGRFDLLLKQGLVGAILAVAAIPVLIAQNGSTGALWGLFIAECGAALLGSYSLRHCIKQD
jgi:O-antigen/teichoic acid export membrane protein